MTEQNKKIVTGVILAIIFCVCVALVILGHRNIGLTGLVTQLVGLAGLLGLLAYYNSKYK